MIENRATIMPTQRRVPMRCLMGDDWAGMKTERTMMHSAETPSGGLD
jgi:hypothetical protein